VNKDDYARLRFLVNEEHTGAKPVHGGHEAGLGVHILRPTIFEDLVCVGKLAGVNVSRALGVTMTFIAVPSLTNHPLPRHLGE